MKILIFTHNYPINSQERRNAGTFVYDFSMELAKTNSVTVVCPGSFEKRVRFGAVDVYFFSWRGGKHLGKLKLWNPIDLFYGLSLFFRGIVVLLLIVKEIRPDFSLAMWAIPGGIFAYFAKLKFQIPYAVWVLGSDFYIYSKIPIVGFLIRRVLKRAEFIVADGVDLSGQVSKIIGRKCIFLPSCTNIDNPDSNQRKNNNGNTIVLTFVGRMEFIKGPDILLTALSHLKCSNLNLEVHYIGDGSLLPRLKSTVVEGNVARITFHGNVSDEEKSRILQKTDWLVIPSRSDSIPLAFSEAMKLGVPVISSSLPDLKYLVNKYKVGYLFKSECFEELAQIIQRLPKEKNSLRNFRKNTRKVAGLFSISHSTKEFENMISQSY